MQATEPTSGSKDLDASNASQEFHEAYNEVVARYYDGAYEMVLAASTDVQFYTELAIERPGPVLELGCGTGRVLLELYRAGIECVGLDSSQAMLARLRERAHELRLRPHAGSSSPGPELFLGRMQDFDLAPRRFQLIYSAFRPFQHLYTVDDQLSCLRTVLRHLEPGGRFAFDVFNPKLDRAYELSEPESGDLRFRLDGREVVRYVSLRRDPAQQMIEARMRFETLEQGRPIKNETELVRMRWFTRFELEHLMARAGYENVMIYGDFDRSPVGHGSPELVVVGSAPG